MKMDDGAGERKQFEEEKALLIEETKATPAREKRVHAVDDYVVVVFFLSTVFFGSLAFPIQYDPRSLVSYVLARYWGRN